LSRHALISKRARYGLIDEHLFDGVKFHSSAPGGAAQRE
jgi:hypothetical protein